MFGDDDDVIQDIGDTLIVSNLHPEATEEDLRITFGYYGALDEITFLKDDQPTKTAVVKYLDSQSASLAYHEQQKRFIKGRLVEVSLPVKKEEKKETMPTPTLPPEDEEEQTIIDTFCTYLNQSEKPDEFILVTQQTQKDNEDFSFLFPGGKNHNYYLWKRYCLKHNLSQERIDELVKQHAKSNVPQIVKRKNLSVKQREKLMKFFEMLNYEVANTIEEAKTWILQNDEYMEGIVEVFVSRILHYHDIKDMKKKMSVLYLVDKILKEDEKWINGFLPSITKIIKIVASDQTVDQASEMKKIVQSWKLDPSMIEHLQNTIHNESQEKFLATTKQKESSQKERKDEEIRELVSLDHLPVGILSDIKYYYDTPPYTPYSSDMLPTMVPPPQQTASLMSHVEAFYFALSSLPLSQCKDIKEIENEMENRRYSRKRYRSGTPPRIDKSAKRMSSYARY